MDIVEKLKSLRKMALEEAAFLTNKEILEKWRIKYLGRQSDLARITDSLKNLAKQSRAVIGKEVNEVKTELNSILQERLQNLKSEKKEIFDVTLPGKKIERGFLHPLTLVQRRIKHIFVTLGFEIVSGPEIETPFYNFDALNIPQNHPARDAWNTLWLKAPKTNLLRTHTSPVQVRYMQKHEPPFKIIVPGRVFRYEATDMTHEIQFYQVEGLVVAENISLADFKGTIEIFFKRFFGPQTKLELRPSFYPFVEPGVDVVASCPHCKQKGCQICKHSGWVEMMGAGMVHQNVFEAAGYVRNQFQGFAFGLGVERFAMIKYKIPDIRMFYENDLRLIKQFG